MEPRIQYAKTSDGVSIAFSTLGEGVPAMAEGLRRYAAGDRPAPPRPPA